MLLTFETFYNINIGWFFLFETFYNINIGWFFLFASGTVDHVGAVI